MDSDPQSQPSIAALAKAHLGYSSHLPDHLLPQFYLDELNQHLGIYPYDSNFRIEVQPRHGFGVATCLEIGCDNVRIPLEKRVKVADGGKKEGFGSLSAYRAHVVNHPTHKRARLARIKAQATKDENGRFMSSPTSSSLKKENTSRPSLLSRLDASFGPSTSSRVSMASNTNTSNIKPEPSEPVIPQKRLSDTGLPSTSSHVKAEPFPLDRLTIPSTPPAKKVKAEVPKTPLATVDRNNKAPPPAANSQLEELDRTLAQKRNALYVFSGHRRRTKDDKRRFTSLSKEIDRLLVRRNVLVAQIAAAAPPAPAPALVPAPRSLLQPAVKPEVNQSGFGVFAGPNMNQLQPQAQMQPYAFSLPLKGDQRHAIAANPLYPQPAVASGSNVRLPDIPGKMDVDEDEDHHVPPDVHFNLGMHYEDENGYGEDFDQDGNWKGRGRDRFVGPTAARDDIDKFLVAAGNSEQFDGNASVDKALEKLGLHGQYELIPGMTVALMPHQIIGVAWMVDKEIGQQKLEGGILADEMGLGKTVQMIATMVMNRSDDPRVKTTLIIAPTALLDQWKLEIETKTNIDIQCHIYHGNSKAKTKKSLQKYDIVLTTYMTLALEWPDLEAEEKAAEKKKKKKKTNDFIDDSDDEAKPMKKKKEKGLLYQMDWYRVILDEAQNIRNKRTRNARCVTDLDTKYRWCLTGTPITNSILDAYSLFRFLRLRPWYDWQDFNQHIAKHEKKNPTLATRKLQAIFATTLLRRKKDSELDGKRLIELPEKKVDLLKLEFSEEERVIYQMVEARSQAKFNRFLRAGTVLKNYHQVLVLLLRLRQICSHPALIQEDGVALVLPDEMDESVSAETRDELSRARDLVSAEFVAKMKHKLKEITLRRIEAEKESIDAVVEEEECPVCMDIYTDAVLTPCAHTFCRDCIVNVLNGPDHPQDLNEVIRYKANEKPCPSCRSPVSLDRLFARQAFEPTDADLFDDESAPVKSEIVDVDDPRLDSDIAEDAFLAKDVKGKGKAPAKKRLRRRVVDSEEDTEGELDSDLDDFIVQSDEDESEKDTRLAERRRSGRKRTTRQVLSDAEDSEDDEDNDIVYGRTRNASLPTAEDVDIKMLPRFLPSTKMKKMMESLLAWQKDHPDEKTIIVSQWTQCLQLVSDYLTENGFLHVKYQGDMNRAKRDQAIRVFMSKDSAPIMLMSLKCGAFGLNITRANRVISLDLGWSEAVEAQAFDRVHRLGQTRDVFVQRLVISNTVEDRVLALQERKKSIADGSLGEGSGKKIGRLSVRELANLFGLDARGQLL